MRDERYRMRDEGCWMKDPGCGMQDVVGERTGHVGLEAGCGLRNAACGIRGNRPENPTVVFQRYLEVCSLALPSIVVLAFSLSGKFTLVFRGCLAKCHPLQSCCRSSSPQEI